MNEKERIRELDYLIAKADIPSSYQAKVRDLMANVFLEGVKRYHSGVNPRLENTSFFFSETEARVEYDWDNKKITRELEKYADLGKVTGEVSQNLDYEVCALDDGVDVKKVRGLAAMSNIVSRDYVLTNAHLRHKTRGNLMEETHQAIIEFSYDFDTLDYYLDEFLSNTQGQALR